MDFEGELDKEALRENIENYLEKDRAFLNETELCAIKYALLDAETDRPGAVEGLQAVSEEFLDSLTDPDPKNAGSSFVDRTPKTSAMLTAIARLGLEEMEKDENYARRLSCNHGIAGHRNALASILLKFPVTEN